jgi:hypothetical protein
MIILGFLIIIITGTLMLVTQYFGIDNYIITTILLGLETFGIAFTYISATAAMLKSLPTCSGSGVALSGFTQMVGAGLIAYAASFMHIDTVFTLGLLNIICSGAAIIIISTVYNVSKRKKGANSNRTRFFSISDNIKFKIIAIVVDKVREDLKRGNNAAGTELYKVGIISVLSPNINGIPITKLFFALVPSLNII